LKGIRTGFALVVLIALLLSACSRHARFHKQDLACIPYTGNEVLVFKSDYNRIDSFVMAGMVRETKVYGGSYRLVPRKQDYLAIQCSTSTTAASKSPFPDSMSFSLISVEKLARNEVRVIIDVLYGTTANHSEKSMRLEAGDWDKLPVRSLKVPAGEFNDVVLMDELYISPIRRIGKDFVAYFFWSKSAGLVKFRKEDGSTWELIEKRQRPVRLLPD
jgi:hypothetical protein